MFSKTILAGSLIAIFAVSMFAQNAIATGHLTIDEWKAKTYKKDPSKLRIELETDAPIPVDGSAGAFGYGFITNGFNNVLALTTHQCASDSLVQGSAGTNCPVTYFLGNVNPPEEHNDATFHAHVLDLKNPTSACDDYDAEVDVASTINTGNNVSPNWEVEVNNNQIEVSKVPISDLGDGTVEAAVAFIIVPVVDGNNQITNLCLDVQP